MPEGQDESQGYCLDKGGSKGAAARANRTGVLRGSNGGLKGLTIMRSRDSICRREISTIYGMQPGQFSHCTI